MEAVREPDFFQFNRVVFGVAQEHARTHPSDFPLAAEKIMKSTYMNDTIDFVPEVKTAVEVYSLLSQIWGPLKCMPESSDQMNLKYYGASHLQTVQRKLIFTVVNYRLLKPCEFCSTP